LESAGRFLVAFGTYLFTFSNDDPSQTPKSDQASNREYPREHRTPNFEHPTSNIYAVRGGRAVPPCLPRRREPLAARSGFGQPRGFHGGAGPRETLID
jgi:hypothetical protein